MAEKSRCDFPKARKKGLLVEEVAGELLVYDSSNDRAHCLNESAATIWKHCDGVRSVGAMAAHLFPELPSDDGQRFIQLGLERLRRRHLLDEAGAAPIVDLSKRQLLKKIAIVATAAGVLAPLVSTVIAPTPANAFSCMPSGMPCSSSAQCCSGLCRNLQCV
jgi:hypothetical protein